MTEVIPTAATCDICFVTAVASAACSCKLAFRAAVQSTDRIYLGLAEWGTLLHNQHLTMALCDPLTETGHVFNMKDCVSLRDPLDKYKNLMDQRCLEASILDPLLATGKVYADQRGNAVFLMVAGKANRPIGAEL